MHTEVPLLYIYIYIYILHVISHVIVKIIILLYYLYYCYNINLCISRWISYNFLGENIFLSIFISLNLPLISLI